MTTPWPVKLASPCSCTHITRSPSLQSSGDVFSNENCFARVFPSATGLTASDIEDKRVKDGSRGEFGTFTHRDETDWEGEKL